MIKALHNEGQRGNALIYVLIAIVLFAALGFTLSRQTQNSSTTEIDKAKAEIYAAQLVTYAMQSKSVLDQMIFSGSSIDDLDLTLPNDTGFSTAPHIHKVYHPQGGGLTPANLSEKAIDQISSSPPAGWYLGHFSNIEWSKSTRTDVILTAYQIARPVCEAINLKITGSNTIPSLAGNMSEFLIDHTTNSDLNIADCGGCEGYMSLCVSNNSNSAYSFYSVVADR
ncbi:MAG: hypothetical protein ACRBDL_07915 [Alphaproteobacteria bacterium]